MTFSCTRHVSHPPPPTSTTGGPAISCADVSATLLQLYVCKSLLRTDVLSVCIYHTSHCKHFYNTNSRLPCFCRSDRESKCLILMMSVFFPGCLMSSLPCLLALITAGVLSLFLGLSITYLYSKGSP